MKRSQEKTTSQTTVINPPWASKVSKNLISRLYSTDAKGIIDEELIDEVGYGLLARCESILIVTEAGRGRVKCPRCGWIIHHNHGSDEILKCDECEWQMNWKTYKRTSRRKQLAACGMEPFFIDYVKKFPKAKKPREKMLLIDGLIHRWHWEQINYIGRPGAANLIEGSVQDIIEFLNRLTYTEKSTPGLLANLQEWRQKPQECAEERFGSSNGVVDALESPHPSKRMDAIRIIDDLDLDTETLVARLKSLLKDPNRKIRRKAAGTLIYLDVDREQKIQEFLPLLVLMLKDRSARVRRFIARILMRDWAEQISLKVAARAFLDEDHPKTREKMEELLRAVFDANERKSHH